MLMSTFIYYAFKMKIRVIQLVAILNNPAILLFVSFLNIRVYIRASLYPCGCVSIRRSFSLSILTHAIVIEYNQILS